jgi:DNA-binding transcriptional MerR regulator
MERLTIGELARRAGVPVRTLRFWSDEGLVPVAERSAAGYRLYGTEAIARVDLVRALRELGLGLDAIAEILRRRRSLAEIAETHVAALDARIRILRIQRTVLRIVAARGGDLEEMTKMQDLAKMAAAERQRIVDDFVARAFDGIDGPSAAIGAQMRILPRDLPDDPAPEQIEAWIELGALLADEDFAARVRAMAVAGAKSAPPPIDPRLVVARVGAAIEAGLAPDDAAARAIVEELAAGLDRAALADALAVFTDRRVERYWQLLGTLNGWPPRPSQVPAFEWLIAALRAHR